MQRRLLPVALALVGGYAAGSALATYRGSDVAYTGGIDELKDLMQELALRLGRLETRLGGLPSEQPKETRSEIMPLISGESISGESAVSAALRRIEAHLDVARTSAASHADLRALSGLRERFPIPIQQALHDFVAAARQNSLHERTLWFLTKSQAIQRFGSPTTLMGQGDRWEYENSPKHAVMTLVFTNGIISSVEVYD